MRETISLNKKDDEMKNKKKKQKFNKNKPTHSGILCDLSVVVFFTKERQKSTKRVEKKRKEIYVFFANE